MAFAKEEIVIPPNFEIVHHDFYTYDPSVAHTIEENFKYLTEDLFQVLHIPTELTVDLGWYGSKTNNKGEFILQVIRNDFWDAPVSKMLLSSQKEIAEVLNKTLQAIHLGVLD